MGEPGGTGRAEGNRNLPNRKGILRHCSAWAKNGLTNLGIGDPVQRRAWLQSKRGEVLEKDVHPIISAGDLARRAKSHLSESKGAT